MKKIFLPISIFSALIFMGCSAGSSNESVSENIAIEDTAVADSMESEEELQITFPDTCKRRQVRTSEVDSILFFYISDGTVKAVDEDGRQHPFTMSLDELAVFLLN